MDDQLSVRSFNVCMDFLNTKSSCRKWKQGVAQVEVFCPTLFNLYLRKISNPLEGFNLVAYADDCTILARERRFPNYADRIAPTLNTEKLVPEPKSPGVHEEIHCHAVYVLEEGSIHFDPNK